jgi:DNA polymerase III epsilon subunit-like protein
MISELKRKSNETNYISKVITSKRKVIVKKKNSKTMIGDVVLNDNSLNNNKFYLHFNPNQSIAMMIQSLIHELTHIKQISHKELKPSGDYKTIM